MVERLVKILKYHNAKQLIITMKVLKKSFMIEANTLKMVISE